MIANPTVSQQIPEYDSIGIAKRTTSLIGAGVMTFGLLFVMTQMVAHDEAPVLEQERQFILPRIGPEPKDQPPVVKKVEPLVINAAPELTKVEYGYKSPLNDEAIRISSPVEDITFDTKTTVGLPGGVALVPISPLYPERAATLGLCGHVIVQYDITADGLPNNVAIIESSHRLFNKNAVRAVQRARYKPHLEGGKPAAVNGRQEKITFRLDDGC